MNTPNFPENCMKSKEFGRPGGGVRPSRPPLDPPMTTVEDWMEIEPSLSLAQQKLVGYAKITQSALAAWLQNNPHPS